MRGLLCLLALAATACGCDAPDLPAPIAAAGRPGPRAGGALRIALAADVRTLDPALALDEYSLCAERLIFDGLVGYRPAASGAPLELEGVLAESWTISDDRRVYTFQLREGLVYEDGRPIVADDFVVSLERVRDPATGSPGRQYYEHVIGVRALDARRLEVRIGEPDASFLMVLAMPFVTPVPRTYAQQQGVHLRERPLASGPFRLERWQEGQRMTFVRNPRYWKAPLPYLDRLELQLQAPPAVAALELLRGELDTLDEPSSDKYVQLMRSPSWRPHVHATPGNNVFGVFMDVTRAPFDRKAVRQAMNLAIRKQDTYQLLNGRMVVSHGVLPPTTPGFDAAMPPYPHDPARARELLSSAGYPHGFDVDYYVPVNETLERLAQSLQADLAEVGVRMHIHVMSFPAYVSAVERHQLGFGFTAWSMDFPDPRSILEAKFHSKSVASNDSGYHEAKVDALLDAARVEPDSARRLQLYHRVEEILFEDCPWIWHYHGVVVAVLQPYVMAYSYHPVYLREYRAVWLDRM